MISGRNQNPKRDQRDILRDAQKKEDVKRFFCNYLAFMIFCHQ